MVVSSPAGESLVVLVVDDNHDAANSLESLLRLWGYQVRVAYSGSEALQIADETHPHCILLDINMPEMDGFTVARRLREHPEFDGVRIIAWTAYSDDANLRRIRESGFNDYLNKLSPFDRMRETLEHCREGR